MHLMEDNVILDATKKIAVMKTTMKLHEQNTLCLVSTPSFAKQRETSFFFFKFCGEHGCVTLNFL